ncbi:MAG: AAA family ATPase [Thermoguttaceae bacterium]|jgi:type II secretory pathway predicted ATPase ExeA
MYGAFFGLKKQPFASVPQTDQYFPAATVDSARVALTRCLERGEGVGMVTGPTGTGKSLLCRLLAEQFKATFPVVELSCGRLSTRRSLFQAILYKLGQPYRGMDEGELRIALVDYLTLGKAPYRGMILIVDEAHTLPLRLLDEIRMLTNLAGQGRPIVRLVLAGNGSLEERFAGPKMESFNQRISTRCYLESLGRSEAQDYIHAQIDLAGGCGMDLFSEDACQSVFKATDGVPRLINQLCDHALLVAYAAGCRTIDPAQIEAAWADLQQLPTPWNGDGQHEQCGVIEFGRIDDSADEASPQTAAENAEFPALRVANDFDEVEAELSEVCQQIEHIEQPPAGSEDDFQPLGTIQPEIELVFTDADHPFEEAFEQEEVITDRYAASTPAPSPILQPTASTPPVDGAKLTAIDTAADQGQLEGAPSLQGARAAQAAESAETAAETENNPQIPRNKPRPIGATRRHEYSRLFAKLLQGTSP